MNPKKTKRRLNIIDFLIIAFVVVAAVGGFYRLNLADKLNIFENNETFEVEFIIQNIQEVSQDFFTPGEVFYINIQDTKIGVIKEVLEVRMAEAFVSTVDGEIKKSENSNRIDLLGVFTATGRSSGENACFINGNIFTTCGKEFLVHTSRIEGTITVTSVRKVS